MTRWKRLDAVSAAEWDALMGAATDANLAQRHAWGEYKRALGWEVERWAALRGDEPTGCLQALKRRLPFGRVLVWAPGAPVAGFPRLQPREMGPLLAAWLQAFRQENKPLYVRFYSFLPTSPEASYSLSRVLSRPLFRINSGFTSRIDLTRSMAGLRAAMTGKHRYYAKRAEAAGLQWKWGRSEDLRRDMLHLNAEMCATKQSKGLRLSPEDLDALHRAFGEDFLILAGYRDSKPVTACVVLIGGRRAFYLSAATGTGGREMSAGYAMVLRLFDALKARGIDELDFGGLAPGEASGVDHFKRGFGGEIVESLGEWEWVPADYLRLPVNLLIRRKLRHVTAG